MAAYTDDVDAVTFLVDKGADVSIKDEHEVGEVILYTFVTQTMPTQIPFKLIKINPFKP